MASAEEGSIPVRDPVYRLLKAVRGSLLLFFVLVGVVLLVAAVIFDTSPIELTQQDGVIAGMLGVFGISSVASAGTLYLLVRTAHRRAQP